jgi:hypothetical protein
MVALARRASSRGALALLFCTVLLITAHGRAHAQCVGDCAGDGEVTINDLILGVNIALGSQPVSACEAFANGEGEVTIAQLIQGVNNALEGCPPPADTPTATAVATATATGIPTGTSTATATVTQPAVATATQAATLTLTGTRTRTRTPSTVPTATHTIAAAATDTVAPTATATSEATATATAEPTSTDTAAPTATAPSTATDTAEPTATATAEDTATATATAQDTATPTVTSVPTATATPPNTATPTETSIPAGDSIAGRAALLSSGLGGIQSLVAAVVTAATNDGAAALLVHGVEQGLPPPIDEDDCPISGTTTQSCTEMGSGVTKTISLVLGANECVAPGPLGGSGEFDGSISIDSTAFFLNSCSPLVFLGGAYDVTDLTVVLRNAMMNLALTVSANLDGNVTITGANAQCLVGSLNLTVNGTLASMLPDGTGVEVQFLNTGVVMNAITYNADCVPLIYTLTFNGNAVFQPLENALLEASAPLISGAAPLDQQFSVTFSNFVLKQNATTSPVIVEMDGNLTSSCFGGLLTLDTLTPLAVAAGQLCPNVGEIAVSSNGQMATVSYDNGMVAVTPDGGATEVFDSCLSPELLMCPAE